MRPNLKFIVKTSFGVLFLFFYCEFLIFYAVQLNCDWPQLDPDNEDTSIEPSNEDPVKIMVIADTHLLGSRKGHWFDKLRREWQMYRAFQSAMTLHKPDLVFVLGDLTDEGLYCSSTEFEYYVNRFYSLFAVPEGTKIYVAVGNHDIGFHYGVSPYLNQRFVKAFDAPVVKMISLRGNHFVLVNSMALEGDGCFLCKPAEQQLTKIEKILKCTKGTYTEKCKPNMKLAKYSRPILMQHYPLYRQSDMECNDFDAAPFPIKQERFRERWECLSQEATYQLLNQVKPRLSLSGHTHHGCTRPLPVGEGLEVTIPSFSWRNKDNPNYLLATITPNNYAYFKCELPRESTVINLYLFGTSIFIIWLLYSLMCRSKRKYKFR
ncbi:metallophosphoesterase 1 isoform X1 [Diabrotica virgifera virgifera]|uniref:Metallophosphoesterase 1 isoform X1 n=1 Tax=Diabrotica virgifera virgifera TaxID=50390 RepID=A0A6P7FA34_DIAVI|nr:metallophosphoesterase 1 isoform X1 [Diabrotica virgifera virgifera]